MIPGAGGKGCGLSRRYLVRNIRGPGCAADGGVVAQAAQINSSGTGALVEAPVSG